MLVASGLGYTRLGGNPSGVPGVRRFNARSAAGALRGEPFAWTTKVGSPDSRALAEAVYRFQHEKQCGDVTGPGARSLQDVYSALPNNCVNRDGMLGHKTMCMIVQSMTNPGDAWGDFWRDTLVVGHENMAKYGGPNATCRLRCGQVACSRREAAGCAPCASGGSPPGAEPPQIRTAGLSSLLWVAAIGVGAWAYLGGGK